MKEKQKHLQGGQHRLPLVGPEGIKNLERKESRRRSLRSLLQAHSSMRKCWVLTLPAAPERHTCVEMLSLDIGVLKHSGMTGRILDRRNMSSLE